MNEQSRSFVGISHILSAPNEIVVQAPPPFQPSEESSSQSTNLSSNFSPNICVTRRVRRVTTPMFTKAVTFEMPSPPSSASSPQTNNFNLNMMPPLMMMNPSSFGQSQQQNSQPQQLQQQNLQQQEPLQLTSNRTLSLSSPMLVPIRGEYDPYQRMSFEEACSDPNFTVSPTHAGFMPRNAWGAKPIAFGLLVATFFRKRNSMHCKFPYKLYNALRLTMVAPSFYRFIGIKWVTDTVFVVDKLIFAKLLGVRSIDGSFFHQQGNFPSHGFEELQFALSQRIAMENGIGDFDPLNLRFLRHQSGMFTRYSSESDIIQLKWSKL